jgi:hypothetical protein
MTSNPEVISLDEFVRDARLWLDDHGCMLPSQRPPEKLAAASQSLEFSQLKISIIEPVDPVKPASWVSELASAGPNHGEALLDW